MISKSLRLIDTVRWYSAQFGYFETKYDNFILKTIKLGEWLRKCNYIGIDVSNKNPPRLISTVPAFAMLGWLNLADFCNNELFLGFAKNCLDILLHEQIEEGCWLFPYKFRNNPEGFAYSCENFMTIECMMEYWRRMDKPEYIRQSVAKALKYLLERIGHRDGTFWYSSADKIYVPNISSMAARVFAEASKIYENPVYFELAKIFVGYCISQQTCNGAYPYFQDKPMVYIPYHALEIWELYEANKVLQDQLVDKSLRQAIDYLRLFIERNGYVSHDPLSSKAQLMKTPVWVAKSFLVNGFIKEAKKHLFHGLRLFEVPGRTAHYFYRLENFMGLMLPSLDTCFIRYNSSAFEISTFLLRQLYGNHEIIQ